MIDAFRYFHEKANGIFLWVVVVLHQLSRVKSSPVFRKYVAGFSDASGDMERLYSKVLLSVENEDQKCMRVILKWLVVTKVELNLVQLKAVVEWSLDDKLPQFRKFAEVDCGALLHFIPMEDDVSVQFIHETLRSFLTNKTYPPYFHVDEGDGHSYAARVCLDILSSGVACSELRSYSMGQSPAPSKKSRDGARGYEHYLYPSRFARARMGANGGSSFYSTVMLGEFWRSITTQRRRGCTLCSNI